ncbi:hypothetical protein DMUE_0886 [Dictyocoela muelleri]|nr:hypothetical protein DMUE_0886 [Dictyocoela muelleri]
MDKRGTSSNYNNHGEEQGLINQNTSKRYNSGKHRNLVNKNIFLQYFFNSTCTPRGQDKLNSIVPISPTVEDIESITNRGINKFDKKITIDYKIEDTDIKMTREIYILDNYNQNVFEFIENFRETAKLTNWSDKVSLKVLKSLISDEIRIDISDSLDVERAFNIILRNKYLIQYLPRLSSYLQSLKLANFKTIDEYCIHIKEVIKRVEVRTLIQKWNSKENLKKHL